MKWKSQALMLLIGFMAFSAMAQPLTKPETAAPGPPDKETISYAQGMRMGLQLRQAGLDADFNGVLQGFKDALEGKPTKIPESEMALLFRQAQTYELAKQAEKDKSEGAALLARSVNPQGAPSGAPDKEKFSYAIGARNGLYFKSTAGDVKPDLVIQAFKDVIEGKPTRLQESEVGVVLERAQAYETAQKFQKNKSEGEAFLAKNAKAPGMTVLPDGLQYRVLQAGAGPIPTTNDLLFIKYRGSFLDGKEFARHNHFLTRSTGGPKGWQEALQRMKVGAKWQIFVPPALGFGAEGDPIQKVGPEATLIYELELLSIAQPGDPGIGTGRLGHGLDGEVLPPNSENK